MKKPSLRGLFVLPTLLLALRPDQALFHFSRIAASFYLQLHLLRCGRNRDFVRRAIQEVLLDPALGQIIDSQKNWLKAMADVMDTDQADTRADGRAPT
jgi:hypothetical protein